MPVHEQSTVKTRDELVRGIVDGFRAVNRATDRSMLPLLVELGLTMPQFKALIAVTSSGADGISVTELGHELSIGQPSASLVVDQLERPGYVVRVPDSADRRRVLVKATELGADITGELRMGRRTTFRAWLEEVSDEDMAALERGLEALSAVVQASPLGRPLR